MQITEQKKNIAPQICPLCKEEQDVIVNGWIKTATQDKGLIDETRGYSFCNCHDIFYTDWKNITQGVYDEEYTKRYSNKSIDQVMLKYVQAYRKLVKEYMPTGRFTEIGCINPVILNAFKQLGYTTCALDIIKHDFEGHENIACDFENGYMPNTDIIWASHIFEHFREPVLAAEKCYQSLNDGGLLFVAMPDPYFIDFKAPYAWGHWHIQEHHIMWNMQSFCSLLKNIGFEIIMAKHNCGQGFICVGDFHILARKI